MANKCPSCERVLYSRRLKQCGYCGASIPEELRFTQEEISERDREIEQMKTERKLRDQAAVEAKEAKRRARRDDGMTFPDFLTNFFNQ